MNKTLLFFCISTSILTLSIIVISISPIINNVYIQSYNWSFSSWRTLNCKFFADKENSEQTNLDDIQKMKKMKNICNRKKVMHDLEFASLIIDIAVGFICANLSLLHYLNVGKNFEKKTGIIGFIGGIIGFIITFVYICFNAYIFDNDIAYAEVNFDYFDNNPSVTSPCNDVYCGKITKLYSNGATRKRDSSNGQFIYPYTNVKDDYAEFIKYKDLGKKEYNYDSKLYNTYMKSSDCRSEVSTSCEYIYEQPPTTYVENKDLYDRWLTTLILGIIIVISHLGLLIFGFLLFKSSGEPNEAQTVAIV